MGESLVILYEDNHCLALAKPAPLLTQSASAEVPNLEAMARDYLREKYHKTGRVYLGIPHRLDRPVSGVILFARQTESARRLAAQFEKHQVEKVYWAVVDGVVPQEEGIWEDWLRKLPEQSRTEVVSGPEPGAKMASLAFRRLRTGEGWTLLELRPRTGRMHQLRVQTASRGWPVRGDTLYGSVTPFGLWAELPRERRIALHARSLTFLHPVRYEPITLTAAVSEEWLPFVGDANSGESVIPHDGPCAAGATQD